MSAIDQVFQKLRKQNRKALIPFITAGDPDLDFTIRVLRELSARGCALCELGIPYSDPIADGPVIQASYSRALDNRLRLADILQAVTGVSAETTTPLITMVSYAIIFRHGLERFVTDARQSGISGLIVPDLLVEEAKPLADICDREDMSLIQLVTPTTPRDRALRIATTSTGFLYYVSVTGITGERSELPDELLENVSRLREQAAVPICIGFGINQPEHVARLAPVADGLIVGSAIVKRVALATGKNNDAVLGDVGRYVTSLIEAMPASS